MPVSLRPAAALLVAAVWLCAAATCAADDGGDITSLLPPGTASPFPFCPVRPAGASTGPFPWMTSPPPPSTTLLPQDPGFLASGACPVGGAVAWPPLLAVFSAFLVPWMYQ
ncbi:hypothetical protein HU200_020941 [Digitaria exilis]|uniref:Uncharacterized protein n=1 Tax=Digitaria exilis TaxID=1010633 RepID=A0A835KCD2_9POAL|nr:hypothetical protein HU200_020941 [Digitaria exilis]CAB3472506.1 unnamed protein product [Digitaria exilis]